MSLSSKSDYNLHNARAVPTLWKHITNKSNQIIDKRSFAVSLETFKNLTEALCESICFCIEIYWANPPSPFLHLFSRLSCYLLLSVGSIICDVTLTFSQIEYTSNIHEAIFTITYHPENLISPNPTRVARSRRFSDPRLSVYNWKCKAHFPI